MRTKGKRKVQGEGSWSVESKKKCWQFVWSNLRFASGSLQGRLLSIMGGSGTE